MKSSRLTAALIGLGLAGMSGRARAAEILVTSDVTTSQTWSSSTGDTYNLRATIYVRPGVTLTIDPGTIIKSGDPGPDLTLGTGDDVPGGTLIVCKGATILANGTKDEPIVFTSDDDYATWTGGDWRTSSWREASNEWGNLSLLGGAYISENATSGNVSNPDPDNFAQLEGTTLDPNYDPNGDMVPDPDTRPLFGGGDDYDDSGVVKYVQLRYGGKVIALANELNGLSMGGVGCETDVHHVEIMNNVDDGIEIFGGTVNVAHFSIWNIGDDSFDVDNGWRGKAQFGLLVQGYSRDAAQGSGVGDNVCETDGAEQSDWQPVTTSTLYNLTVIGQPVAGDHGTAWRDNARIQYRNCIFMDLGERLVSFDNVDGDGGAGYGFGGTLSWASTWTTAWDSAPGHANDPPGGITDWKGGAQSSGFLAEIKDSVFFRNLHASAYTEATARGVFAPACNNVLIPGFADVDSPVTTLTRGGAVTKGGLTLLPVTFLDPRPANEALTSVDVAPDDGFFVGQRYRGAFHPTNSLWTCGWTAATAFGFLPDDCCWTDVGHAKQGVLGAPLLVGEGSCEEDTDVTIYLSNAPPSAYTAFFFGFSRIDIPFLGGTLVPNPDVLFLGLPTDGAGEISITDTIPSGTPAGIDAWSQFFILENASTKPKTWVASNGLQLTTQ